MLVNGAIRCEKGIKVGGHLTGLENIKSANGIETGADLRCHGYLHANWGIRSGGCIVAAGAISAGESLQAGGEIRAGKGYGIYAGLGVRRDAWEASAQVRARCKPDNLMSGWWAVDACTACPSGGLR